jgi:hypothetical protein
MILNTFRLINDFISGLPYNTNRKITQLSLCLTNQALRHEGVRGSGYIDPYFLDLGTSQRWVVRFTTQPLYPQGKGPSTHWIGGWVDPRVVWTTCRKENSWPYQDSNSDPSVVYTIASRYIDWAILATQNWVKKVRSSLEVQLTTNTDIWKLLLHYSGCTVVYDFLELQNWQEYHYPLCEIPLSPLTSR